MATTKTLTVKTEVPLDRVADLLCCAFEGGVGYWCEIQGYRKPARPVAHLSPIGGKSHVYPHIDYPLCADGAVLCRDSEDDDAPVLVLDRAAIERGLAVMPLKAPRQWGRFLADDFDADTGDAFVQCCLLGALVYG
jgi:hypothetical protein